MKQRIIDRLLKAYDEAPFLKTPELFVLSDKDWDAYLDSLTPTVQETYKKMGYYTVTAETRGTVRGPDLVGIRAISYRGVPVVKRSDYATIKNERTAEMKARTIEL